MRQVLRTLALAGSLGVGGCATAVSEDPAGAGGWSNRGGFVPAGTTSAGGAGSGGLMSAGSSPLATAGRSAAGSTSIASGGSGAVGAGSGGGSAGRSSTGGIDGGGTGAGLGGEATSGTGAVAGQDDAGAAGTSVAGSGGASGTGECCSNGDCLCHGPDPTGLTSSNGPFTTATFTISTGTVYYPTDAEPPFAAVAVCGGFLNTGPEMASWGTFYASYGIVTVITTTGALDFPDVRADKLLASIDEIKAENTKSGSPLNGKLAGRYGTSGYSMGGGGTTIASGSEPTLRSSVGLAPWSPTGQNVKVPTLLLCGASDTTAPCSMAESAYEGIADSTPKMMVTIPGTSHFQWFGPTDAGGGISGETALAFQKVFLEGDERWRPLLLDTRGTKNTNIE